MANSAQLEYCLKTRCFECKMRPECYRECKYYPAKVKAIKEDMK